MPSPAAREAAFLTFDLGTSHLKGALFDRDGRLLGQHSTRHPTVVRDLVWAGQPLHASWQDADRWWTDAVTIARRLLGSTKVDVRAISLSGRGGAGVFVDDVGTVIVHPWSDERHQHTYADLRIQLRQLPGREPSTYGCQLIAKWLHLKAAEPTLASRVAHALYGKDLLALRLTDQAVTDPTSGPDAPQWDARTVAASGIPSALLPRVGLPWEPAGTLTERAGDALGLPPGIPVAIGGHDGICANVGADAGRPGQFVLTLGTHAVLRGILATPSAGAHRFYGLPPDRHVVGGNAWFGGRAADWFLDVAGSTGDNDAARQAAFEALEVAVADASESKSGRASDGPLFLPFLGGAVAPDRRPGARAGFLGLALEHDRAALFRAVLEGTSFALADIADALLAATGEPRDPIRLTGGGARSRFWRTTLANVLQRPLAVSDQAVEGRGAAVFAAVMLGDYVDYDTAARAMAAPVHLELPDAATEQHYRQQRRRWQAAVAATRALDA